MIKEKDDLEKSESKQFTADNLREWADYLDNRTIIRPSGINPATAPETLELLKDILEWDGILPHSKERIRAIIARAEKGKSIIFKS